MIRLLAVLLPAVAALEPAVLDDNDAKRERDYIRRQPTCATTGSAADGAPTPNVLHQIWWQGEAAIPDENSPMRKSWAANHPQWTIKLWDEASATALINTTYSWFAPTFHALPSKIQKADAARYAILHAEGGVYVDMDIEAFLPLDSVLVPKGAPPTAHLFEEPATHWDAHDTVISNGMMAAPVAHPLLLAAMRSIRPVAAVFASSGSHLLQSALTRCDQEEDEANEAGNPSGIPPCGCYVTHSSADFFPLHEAMRQPMEFKEVGEHAEAARALIEDLSAGEWPRSTSYTAQHWTGSWIDAERGSFWLRGIAAARANHTDEAEKLLLAAVWSKWGHKYKYNNNPAEPDPTRAKNAYERALHWRPDYGFAYYELGNLALEAATTAEAGAPGQRENYAVAEGHFKEAVRLSPNALLFVNNLGVALINQGKVQEAMAHFERVIELHRDSGSFIAIKGLDPEAGAHLNLGHALMQLGSRDDAHDHWLKALAIGNYEHAVQAVQRLVADEATEKLPHAALLDLRFGEALAKEGRTRESALRFAAAHMSAANLTAAAVGAPGREDTEVIEGLRATINDRMLALSEVWDEGEGALAETRPTQRGGDGGGGSSAKVQVVETSPDGTLKKTEMTQEEMQAAFKSGQAKARPL